MAVIDTPEVIELLREFGQRVALRGGNPYRAKAYARAAESLGTLTVPLDEVIREGRLREISGVGEAIANIVTRLHETGTHPGLAAMRKEVPAGVLEMLTVPGLRPEKVMKLYKELGITSLAALEAAAKADRLKGVKGLGPALQAKILQGIAIGREAEGRRHIHRAAALLRNAEQRLRQANPNLKRITPAGEFRRGCELVSDLSLVVELQGAEVGTMRSGSQLQQGGEDRLDVYLIARPAQQLPSGHVAEDCGKRILHGADDTLRLGRAVELEAAMDARDHEIEASQDVIRIIERTVGQDVRFNAFEDAEAPAVALVEALNLHVLRFNLLDRQASGVMRGLRVIGDAEILIPTAAGGLGDSLQRVDTIR
jgi:hypothetical protein